MRNSSEARRGVGDGESSGDSGIIEVGRRVLGQLVDTKASAVAMAVTMTIRGCHEDMKLADCWWHTMTKAIAVALTIAVGDCREDVQLAVCWWPP